MSSRPFVCRPSLLTKQENGIMPMTEMRKPSPSGSYHLETDSTQLTDPAVKFYTSSPLPLKIDFSVSILSIQNCVYGFTVLKQMDLAERRKIQS